MLTRPETWDLNQLRGSELGRAIVVTTESVAVRATESLPFEFAASLDHLPKKFDTLVVIGGGTLMDEAKVWRMDQAPGIRLIAIPSLWGSGAEVSPVAVLNRQGKKVIRVEDELIPDIRCLWPELADTVPEATARYACGDVWSHALEGLLSPLADGRLQRDLAELLRDMVALPLRKDPDWFEFSARACVGQAQASVGLIHGIAHCLEGSLCAAFPEANWGHAKLCSIFLWPVMEFNRQHSAKWERLIQEHDLDGVSILKVLKNLHESDAYDQALPLLEQHWTTILRDPCSRTNGVLVRQTSKDFFIGRAFE